MNEPHTTQDIYSQAPNEAAFDFLHFLTDNGMTVERAGGYGEGQSYWYVKYLDEFVCFILFNGTGDEQRFSPLTIWTDDSGSGWYERPVPNKVLQQTAIHHIDICEHCGACSGGTTKRIFGTEYANVCRTTFRFVNPTPDQFRCLKTLLHLRKSDIENRQ